ncbi:hypothetical protein CH293_03125 [Rhodococcus sp. 14-2470-1b]|nr:hypothetical protein CH293_03125 [Rhodococcus sp. 14-2470-1b]
MAIFKALPPGRVMQWHLGVHTDVFSSENGTMPTRFTVTIEATGPSGPADTLTYEIDVGEYLSAAMTVPGTPLSIAKEIKDGTGLLSKALSTVASTISNLPTYVPEPVNANTDNTQ